MEVHYGQHCQSFTVDGIQNGIGKAASQALSKPAFHSWPSRGMVQDTKDCRLNLPGKSDTEVHLAGFVVVDRSDEFLFRLGMKLDIHRKGNRVLSLANTRSEEMAFCCPD